MKLIPHIVKPTCLETNTKAWETDKIRLTNDSKNNGSKDFMIAT